MTLGASENGLLSGWRRRLRSFQAAAAAGIVASVGWLVVMTRWLDAPSIEASDSEILEYYADPEGLSGLASLQILVIATIGFLWFVGVIRGRIGDAEPKLFGTVFFGGGILLAVLMFIGSAAFAAPLVLVEETGRAVDPDTVAMSRILARIVLGVFAPRIGSLFIFSLSTLALRTEALPRWLILVSYAVGVAMFLNVTMASPNVYVFPAWMALVSVVLLFHPPRISIADTL
ncbi:MAG: hypothetical protein OEW83_18440 [Acidimicrobiia bacterium]|nr:hypothetical protein [Acidimicrobiia bacterium]